MTYFYFRTIIPFNWLKWKRDYSMIPERDSYNENPNQNEFWLVFFFLLTLKSKLLEWLYYVSQKGLFHDAREGFLQWKPKPKWILVGFFISYLLSKVNFWSGIIMSLKRDYSMIPERGSYNENPNQNEFWLVFLFLTHSQK